MPDRYLVIVTDLVTDDLAPERDVLDDIADVTALGATSEEELAGRIEDADAIMMYHLAALNRETLTRLNRCRVVARVGVGYENVDVAAARELGIPVCNVPDYGTEEVADNALAHTLSLLRGVNFLNSRCRDHDAKWHYHHAVPLHRLRGRVFGIVGMGRIGTTTAHRVKAFGMRVVFYDPYVADGWDKAHGVERVETLEELLAVADVLSIHCPSNDETRGMIGAEAIGRMKPGSFVINTARGNILDTRAVAEAIHAGRLAGAGIDVFATEPPGEDPLVKAWRDPADPCHERVSITPHAAFYSQEALFDMRVKSAATCRKALLGEPLRNVVN